MRRKLHCCNKTAGEFAHLIGKFNLLNHAHLRKRFQQI